MRKWLLPLMFILVFVLPFTVRAQDTLVFSSLQIDIWPEFDKPSALVIYKITLSPSTTYPAAVSLRIPVTAGDPFAVAAGQPDGTLINIDHTRQVVEQWAIINITTNTPELHLEYYDPGLTKAGSARHFTYTWPGDYAISQLTIQVQQPTNATDMRISPSLGSGTTGNDTLTYYSQDIGAITAGQNFQITIDYQKPDDVLTATTLPVQSSAPIPQGSSSGVNLSSWLPWTLGIVGAALIIGAVIWFWRTSQPNHAPRVRRQRTRGVSYETELNSGAGEAEIYCSQCGKRAMPGDQFCRSCGSPIRAK